MATTGPAWKNLRGMRRVQAEFKHLSADIEAKKFDFIKELTLVDDNMLMWQLKLHNFDNDLPGGRQLNQDLRRLHAMYGQDHILMQIEFPKDYPHQPFFVRLVSPRCQMYTGHVTAGGSICLEALTTSGTPGSWQPDFSVESLLNVILINMIDCPVTHVQTATGPGGRAGPLRIDFSCRNPTLGYSSAEARAAFHRTLENHKRMGWGGQGGAAAAHGPTTGLAGSSAAVAAGMSALPGMVLPPQLLPVGHTSSRRGAAVNVAARSRRQKAAVAVVADASDDGQGGLTGAAAAAPMVPAVAARQSRARNRNAMAAAAAAQPAASLDMIDLCDSDDAEDAILAAALTASLQDVKQPDGATAAAAAAAGRHGVQQAAPIAVDSAAYGAQLRRVSDTAGASSLQPAAAAACARQQHVDDDVIIVSDVDGGSDVDMVVVGSGPSAKQRNRQVAAATGGNSSADKKRRRQSDAVIVGSQDDDDNDGVQVVSSSSPAAAAAGAAAGAGVATRLRRKAAQQQQPAQQQQQSAQQQPQRARTRPRKGQQAQQQQAQGMPLQPVAVQPVVQAVVQQQVVVVAAGAAPRMQVELEYPAHWDYSVPIQSNSVRLVELPLNGHQQQRSVPLSPLEKAAAEADLDELDIDTLRQQGLSRDDALAALIMADGDVDEALVRATTCSDMGGPAAVWRSEQPVEVIDVDADSRQQQQEAAAARRLAEEVEMLLSHLEATSNSTVNRSKVLRIERVQHARLWKRYCLKRSELLETRGGAGLNERLLFHGTSPGTADIITQTGFDFRLVSYSSAYGNGLYFADHSSTAWGYCQKPDTQAAATGMVGANPWVAMPPPPAPAPAPPTGMWPNMANFMSGSVAALMGFPTAPPARTVVSLGPMPRLTAPAAVIPKKRGRKGARASAAYASTYQPPAQRVYKMIIARVALGRQTQGQNGMRKPPDGFDSVNSGNTQVPGGMGMRGRGRQAGQQLYYCHVVFDNDQAFPEYVLTLRA